MASATLSLDQVAKRIAQQETELQVLRQEYESRKKQLGDLNRRKQDLQDQLQQVEGQIQALDGHGAIPAAPPTKTAAKTPLVAKSREMAAVAPASPEQPLSLPQLLPVLLRAAGRPLSIKELTEAVQRKFPDRAGDLLKQASTRVGELVKKGILRRTKDQKAVTLPPSLNGQKPASSAAKTTTKKPSPAVVKSQHPAPAKASSEPPPLSSVLTQILAKSDQPLGGSDLARRAQAAGYQTKSKDFASVVWTTLGKMDDVERVPNQGYRLKKRLG